MIQELLFQKAAKEEVDLMLVSEPNKTMARKKAWFSDEAYDACIIKRNLKLKISERGKGKGFVWIRVDNLYIYSIYVSPNSTETRYEGNKPTFQRGRSESIIDITFVSEKLGGKVEDWRVLEEETLSLHNYTRYNVRANNRSSKGTTWKRGNFSVVRFGNLARRNFNSLEGTLDTTSFVRRLRKTQIEAMHKVRSDLHAHNVYWWTENIEMLRASTLTARRRYCRARTSRNIREEDFEERKIAYKDKRKQLSRSIAKGKMDCWRKLCDEVEEDVWGDGYKITMKSLNQNFPKTDIERDRRIEFAGVLFPEAEDVAWERVGGEKPPLEAFTLPELLEAADRLKINRAPEPDGILLEAIKILAKECGNVFLNHLNGLLSHCNFPIEWKKAQLVLVPKPGRDQGEANGFRPICLLHTMGKLYETPS